MKCTFELNSKGLIKQRESYDLEFKETFHFGDSLAEYLRSIVGMANNKGGEIIFGIKDKPREPKGLQNNKFEDCDPNKINQFLSQYFSHEVLWGMEVHEYYGKEFGRFWVDEAPQKPIVCTKVYKNILREAAIYYRYRGETKEIAYPELAKILANEREKEKKLWLRHVEKIGQVGPQNIHLIDTFNGEIQTGHGKILLDKTIADKLKFIKEGQFSEKDGAPTLKLVGEVTGIVDTSSVPKTDVLYPYRFGDFKDKFGINNFQFQAILWKLDVKGNPKYHTEISTSKTTSTHKYTKEFSSRIQSIFERYPKWLVETVEEYKKSNR
ncbi:AlbA family DNA-binding domain-containing protein [Algoriphagus formosus]|uniref:ATP-binding protein n=1 Tax=Algoriphagus formosus TaxID=2007308 RepID=A0A4R5UWA7_9BACT|nr:ATP-binding protein [Algoriphagus aquimaris]TDK43346.1 ATP-binding protein [Algoriphagus aquimaris]